jgi:hypothetical protein
VATDELEGSYKTKYKVKHTHSEHTLRHPLNINLTINNENQGCKIGTVGVLVGGRRGKEGD